MPFSEESLKKYVIKNFMNSAVNIEEKDDDFENSTINYPIFSEKSDNLQFNDSNLLFKYLENDDLMNEIEYERDYYKQYFIHLCMYSIDQSSRLPFVKFLLIKENNTMNLPKIKLNMQNFIELKENFVSKEENNEENEEKETTSDVDKEFFKQLNKFYQEIHNEELPFDSYKGFLEENENIFVFLDLTKENLNMKNNQKYAILDEIIFSGNVAGTQIDNNIIKLFNNNVLIQNLRTFEGAKIENPKIGYIIDKTDDTNYENLYGHDKEVLLIPPTNDYEEYEDIYIFSSIPLKYDNINSIYRFACFVSNDNDEKSDETFLFQENNTLFYGISEEDLFSQIL